MNTKGRKLVIGILFTILPLSITLQTAEAQTTDSSVQKHKKATSKKRHFITCDSYPRTKLLKKADKYRDFIISASREHKVSPHLITAVITVESCFKPKARSRSGAAGLMQLMPATAKRFGVSDRYNSEKNIHAGTKYLKFLLNRFNGNVKLAAAGYNAGEGAVDKHDGVPPYKQTQIYVHRVLNAYRKLAAAPAQQPVVRKVTTQKSRDWYIQRYNRSSLIRDLNLSIDEIQLVDQLLEPGHMKPVLSYKQFL